MSMNVPIITVDVNTNVKTLEDLMCANVIQDTTCSLMEKLVWQTLQVDVAPTLLADYE